MGFSVSRIAPWSLLFRIYISLDGFALCFVVDLCKDKTVNPAQHLLGFFGEFIPRWPVVSAKLPLLSSKSLRYQRTSVFSGLPSGFIAAAQQKLQSVFFLFITDTSRRSFHSPLSILQHRSSVLAASGLPRRPALTSHRASPHNPQIRCHHFGPHTFVLCSDFAVTG
jgi:hypothetical protein